MANEISISGSLSVAKGTVSDSLSGTDTLDLTGNNYIKSTQNISTAATAINIGSLPSIGQFIVMNDDLTNPVDLLTSLAGTTFTHLGPGSMALGYFPSNITAPAAKATGGSVRIKYMIAEI
jgi:hypothetical protein